jgi:uncharacterized UBP type Zn finger protein
MCLCECRAAQSFAAYEQQDAHEFLMTALDVIHRNLTSKHGECRLSER